MHCIKSTMFCVQGDTIILGAKYRFHTKGEVAKSLGSQARGVQPACTMTTQNSKNQVDK